MPINFASISGISDRTQLAEISRIYNTEKLHFPLVIGYQVSNKNINQGTQNTRQPRFTDLRILDLETRSYGFITALHYYTKDSKTTIEDLEKILEKGIENSSLLQFNTLPPSLEILEKTKNMGFKIILKVAVSNKQTPQGGYAVWKGESVQDVSIGQVNPLVEQAYERKDVIDYLMFDPSHGTNLDLDLNENSLAVKFGKEIIKKKEMNHLGLVYAGGIRPSNVIPLTRLLNSFFPNRVSIDVESGVRTEDKIDLKLVRDYLLEYRDTIQP